MVMASIAGDRGGRYKTGAWYGKMWVKASQSCERRDHRRNEEGNPGGQGSTDVPALEGAAL